MVFRVQRPQRVVRTGVPNMPIHPGVGTAIDGGLRLNRHPLPDPPPHPPPRPAVSDLHRRLFSTWVLASNVLCVIAAMHLGNPAVFDMQLSAFVFGLAHFGLEKFHYKTMDKGWKVPFMINAVGTTWMLASRFGLV